MELYESDSLGSDFTLVFRGLVAFPPASVDFAQLAGVEGAYMANRFLPDSVSFRTEISFDKGGIWQTLTPPLDEACVTLSIFLGISLILQTDCTLNLFGAVSTSRANWESRRTDPGVIVGMGIRKLLSISVYLRKFRDWARLEQECTAVFFFVCFHNLRWDVDKLFQRYVRHRSISNLYSQESITSHWVNMGNSWSQPLPLTPRTIIKAMELFCTLSIFVISLILVILLTSDWHGTLAHLPNSMSAIHGLRSWGSTPICTRALQQMFLKSIFSIIDSFCNRRNYVYLEVVESSTNSRYLVFVDLQLTLPPCQATDYEDYVADGASYPVPLCH